MSGCPACGGRDSYEIEHPLAAVLGELVGAVKAATDAKYHAPLEQAREDSMVHGREVKRLRDELASCNRAFAAMKAERDTAQDRLNDRSSWCGHDREIQPLKDRIAVLNASSDEQAREVVKERESGRVLRVAYEQLAAESRALRAERDDLLRVKADLQSDLAVATDTAHRLVDAAQSLANHPAINAVAGTDIDKTPGMAAAVIAMDPGPPADSMRPPADALEASRRIVTVGGERRGI